MSLHADATISRRQFIRIVLCSTGALSAVKLTPAFADAKARTCRWAFFSDTHIKTEDDSTRPPRKHFYYHPQAHLKQGVREILAAKPDGLILTGDLARLSGQLDDYRKLSELLAPLTGSIPLFCAMGNHDDRDHFAEVFARPQPEKQPVPRKHVLVIEQGPVRFIILDSLMAVNMVPGLLGPEQLDWLRAYLAQADDRPTILCLHHVPGLTGNGFEDAPRLLEIVRPSAKVKAIIFGHSHVYQYDEADGIHFINLPALGYSFAVDQAVGWVEAKFSAREGAFTFHQTEGAGAENGNKRRLIWRD